MAANKVHCPLCHAVLKSSKPIPAGSRVKCLKCGEPFVVAAEAPAPLMSVGVAPPPGTKPNPPAHSPVAVAPSKPASAPHSPPPSPGGLSLGRLGTVLAALLLYLALGTGLGYYCFAVSQKGGPAATAQGPGGESPGPASQPNPGSQPAVQHSSLPEEEQVRINQAIVRAVRYLKTSQQSSGTWSPGRHAVGFAALPGLTLLEAGVPLGDPNVQKAAEFVRKQAPRLQDTYQLALAILFLDRLGTREDRELIRAMALRLIAGQTPTGGWHYNCPLLNPDQEQQLLALLEALKTQTPAEWKSKQSAESQQLNRTLGNLAVLRDIENLKDESFRAWQGDNSNTQFAILGLWAARRYEVPLDRTVMLMVKHFRTTQRADGSWSYHPGHNVSRYPTMTCAGLLGLAIGHGLAAEIKKDGDPDHDPAIEKALAHLGKNIGQPTRQRKGIPIIDLYYLWSVERVGVLYNRQVIGDRDWYAWGAEMLLANQTENGNWQGGGYPGSSPPIDTCFAVLFLKQANLAKDLTSKLQGVGARRGS